MSELRLIGLLAACVLLAGCVSQAPAGPGWEKLGTRTVSYTVDRDQILVTRREGDFRRIMLRVRSARVEFREVRVHYVGGRVQEVILRQEIPAGGESRPIDLAGRDRIIEKVVFWYTTEQRRGRRAVVELWGLH